MSWWLIVSFPFYFFYMDGYHVGLKRAHLAGVLKVYSFGDMEFPHLFYVDDAVLLTS